MKIWRTLLHVEVLIDLRLKLVTHLLGITKKHLGVLFVENWVVCPSIPGTHGALHHNHLLALPHLHTAVLFMISTITRSMTAGAVSDTTSMLNAAKVLCLTWQ